MASIPTVTVKPENGSTPSSTSSTGTPPGAPQFDCFPLKACTEEDIRDTRYHIMKFHSVKKVDPAKDFEQPSRLHRKDPKNLQFQMSLKELEQKRMRQREEEEEAKQRRAEYLEQVGENDGEIDLTAFKKHLEQQGLPPEVRAARLEEKKLELDREKRRLERENQMKLVAPDGGARRFRRRYFRRKTRQIRAYDEAKRKLRYEEYYPWVLEDYDAKQAWVGSYEAGVTDNYCLLVLDNKDKCFKLVPLEKYYRFTPRNKYATLTLEEAEAKMAQGSNGQRWLMKKMAEEAAAGERKDNRYRKFKTTSRTGGDDAEDQKREDEEDMDYDDEFQDDEEAPIMEGNEEENKASEGKMKKEMLRANNLIEHSENESDSDLDDLFETRKVDKQGKKLRKALAQNAMNEVYDSDDEEKNPYLDDSEVEQEDNDDDEDQIITIKKEAAENGETSTVTVKRESIDLGVPAADKKNPQIFVESAKGGVVVIKAPSKILKQFPPGDWNPESTNKRKRSQSPSGISAKRTRLSPSPAAGGEYELTKKDVDELLENGPIQLPALVKALRSKMSRDPNGRANLKRVLKENFDLRKKFVYRRA